MKKSEFIKLYNRPEYLCFEEDLDELLRTEVVSHKIKEINELEKLLIRGEENYD